MGMIRSGVRDQSLTASQYFDIAHNKYMEAHEIQKNPAGISHTLEVACQNLYSEAVTDFWRALSLGDMRSIVPLAYCCLYGLGTSQDIKMFSMLIHEYKSPDPHDLLVNHLSRIAMEQDITDYGYNSGGAGAIAIDFYAKKLASMVENRIPLAQVKFNPIDADHKVLELKSELIIKNSVVIGIQNFLTSNGGLDRYLARTGDDGWDTLMRKCAEIDRSFPASLQNGEIQPMNCNSSWEGYYNDNINKDNSTILGEDGLSIKL